MLSRPRMMSEEPKEERKPSSIQIDKVIGNDNRFLLTELLGEGGFGKVFAAIDNRDGSQVAVKTFSDRRLDEVRELIRRTNIVDPSDPFELQREYFTLLHLEKEPGFPTPIEQGIHHDEPYFVMERLGKSIESIFRDYKGMFSMKTILLLMDQLLERLRAFHHKGLVHGDLKPENMLLGYKSQTVYLVDFGLTTMHRNPKTGNHVAERNTDELRGTYKFMSVHVHHRKQQSRRDDMESLAYVMAFFIRHGELPWDPLVKKRDPVGVRRLKEVTTAEEMFAGQPREFAIFLKEVRAMEYEDEPDYKRYINMFRDLGIIFGVTYEGRRHLDLSL